TNSTASAVRRSYSFPAHRYSTINPAVRIIASRNVTWSSSSPRKTSPESAPRALGFRDTRLDCEASRLLAPLPNPPHLKIGRLDVVSEAVDVEQRMRQPVRGQSVAISFEKGGILGQPQRQRLVVLDAVRHKLGEPDRIQPARRHPPRKCVTHARQYRKPYPQCVARRRVGVVRQRIEEQVSQPMPRQVILGLLARRKYQTPWTDTARQPLFPQVLFRRRIVAQQPQHAAVDRLQQPHPYVKHLRRDLPIVVERTEDKAQFRQTDLRSGRRAF